MNVSGRKKVAEILMRRDGITKREADQLIRECVDEIESGNWNALADVLGLEDDYIFDLI